MDSTNFYTWKRFVRLALCFLLIVALLINISPLGVKATGFEIVMYVGAGLVLTYVLLGLGLTVNNMTTMPDGSNLLSSLTDYVALNYDGMTTDQKIKIYSANPDLPYFVDSRLVDLVRNWIWNNGVLYLTSEKVYGSGFSVDGDKTAGNAYWKEVSLFNLFAGVSSGFLLVSANKVSLDQVTYWGGISVDSTSFDVPVLRVVTSESILPYTSADFPVGTLVEGIILHNRSSQYICRNYAEALSLYSVSGKEYYYLTEDTYIKSFNPGSVGSGKYAYYTFARMGKISSNGSVSYSDFSIYGHSSSANYTDTYPLLPQYTVDDAVGSDLDIITGHVAQPDESLETGYEPWFENAMQLLLGDASSVEDILGLPIVMDSSATQQDVWKGTLEDVLDDTIPPGSVANTPWETFTNALSKYITTPIVDAISSISDAFGYSQSEVEAIGQDGVNQIIDIIPDHSSDLLHSLVNLTDVLSYEGTRCVLPVPAIQIPALPGLFSEITVMEESELNLESFFGMIPDVFLSLVRALFDVAVVGFCLKEFLGLLAGIANGFSKPVDQMLGDD